jgi:hypothetical protein
MKLVEPTLEGLVMELASVFRKHFRLPATVLGEAAKLSAKTPFIAFVLAVCAEKSIMALTPAMVSAIGRRNGLPVEQEEDA